MNAAMLAQRRFACRTLEGAVEAYACGDIDLEEYEQHVGFALRVEEGDERASIEHGVLLLASARRDLCDRGEHVRSFGWDRCVLCSADPVVPRA